MTIYTANNKTVINNRKFLPKLRYFAIAIIRAIIIGLFFSAFFCPNCFVNEEQNNIHVLRYYMYTTFILWECAAFANRYLNKHFDWFKQRKQMLLTMAKLFFLVFIPINAIFIYLRFQVISDTPHLFDTLHMYSLFRTNVIIFLIISTGMQAKAFLQSWKESILRNKEIEKQRLSYELMALKNQINPHFLFNNLNTLSQIVKTDVQLAEPFINQLAKVYRYLLQQKDKNIVTIEEELHFLKSFMYLINIRFKNQVDIKINSENMNGFYVAPIVLQMLIENAIKHNEASRAKPLKVEVKRINDTLVVSNNFQPKKSNAYSSGMGLQNIMSRYSLLTENDILIAEDFNKFEVRIPIIKSINLN